MYLRQCCRHHAALPKTLSTILPSYCSRPSTYCVYECKQMCSRSAVCLDSPMAPLLEKELRSVRCKNICRNSSRSLTCIRTSPRQVSFAHSDKVAMMMILHPRTESQLNGRGPAAALPMLHGLGALPAIVRRQPSSPPTSSWQGHVLPACRRFKAIIVAFAMEARSRL